VDSPQDVCEKCGAILEVGCWPFCGGDASKHTKGDMDGFDQPFLSYVDTQLIEAKDPRCDGVNERGVRGVTINSRSERRAWMKQLGLQYGSQRFENRGKTKYFDIRK
jgi:hypothetical protein